MKKITKDNIEKWHRDLEKKARECFGEFKKKFKANQKIDKLIEELTKLTYEKTKEN